MADDILKYFGISKEPIVGVDLSSSSIKVLELSQDNDDNYKVEHYAIEPLKPGVIVEHKIKDPDAVSRTLRKAIEKSKVKSKKLCLSIPSSEATTKIIQLNLPKGEADIQSELDVEADKYIPFDMEDINIDFALLGKNEEDEELSDVLIALAKKEYVESRIDICEAADLEPSIMDIDIFSIERALNIVTNNLEDIDQKYVALFDIGATSTGLNIFHKGNCVYTRQQSFGGQHLTDEIQNRYGLTYEEALIARRFGDLPNDYATEVLEPFKGTVAQQVARACQFFFSSGEYSTIDYIFLTGGVSTLPGLDKLIQEKTEIKTLLSNPFAEMQVADHIKAEILAQDAPVLMNSCGLALRNFNRGVV